MNRFLWCRFLLPLTGLLVMVGLGLWWSGYRVAVDSSARTLLQSDPRNRETYDKITSLLPETTFVMTALKLDDLFSNRGREVVETASQAILSVEGAVEVKSLTHSGRPIRQGFQLVVEPFFPRQATPEEWEQIRAFTTDFPLSRNVMVSADGTYAVLVGLFQRDLPDHAARDAFRQEFEDALDSVRDEVEEVHVLSFPFVEAAGTNAVKQDLTAYAILASLMVVGVLLVTFRSVAATMLVLLLEGLGSVGLLLIFKAFGQAVDVYTGILFPLMGGLQLTFITHYLSALQVAGRTRPAKEAAVTAFREVIGPSMTAALTTLAGLLTLAFADLPTVNQFGRLGAAGVVAVFALTFSLPACWGAFRSGSTVESPALATTRSGWPQRNAVMLLLGCLVLCVAMLPGIPQVRTDIRAMEFIEEGHPIRHTLEVLNEDLGGTNIFQVQIDTGRPRGLQTRPVLTYMEDLRSYAMGLEGVSDAYAYSQLYVALDQIWEGQTQSTGTLPTSLLKLNLYSNLLNTSPLLFKESFVDAQASESLLILRSKDMPGGEYLSLLKTFMEYAEAHKPEGVRLEPVQGLHTILEGDRKVVSNQVGTLGLSVLSVLALLTISWRSPRHALSVLLVNGPALLVLFGVMGYSGFPLNSITVMVAAVILGIAVDDGIHLVGAFRSFRRRGESAPGAASVALELKFRPMACTTSILAVFLGLLSMTSFPPVAHFGLLSALGLGVAFLGAVLILPVVLAKLG